LKCLGLGYSEYTVGYVGVKSGDCEIAGFGGSEYQIVTIVSREPTSAIFRNSGAGDGMFSLSVYTASHPIDHNRKVVSYPVRISSKRWPCRYCLLTKKIS
jgi:hypothetical protein